MLGGSKISTGNKDRPVTTGSDTRLIKIGPSLVAGIGTQIMRLDSRTSS